MDAPPPPQRSGRRDHGSTGATYADLPDVSSATATTATTTERHRVRLILAACTVLHRLVRADPTSIGPHATSVVCRAIREEYNLRAGRGCGRGRGGVRGTTGNGGDGGDEDRRGGDGPEEDEGFDRRHHGRDGVDYRDEDPDGHGYRGEEDGHGCYRDQEGRRRRRGRGHRRHHHVDHPCMADVRAVNLLTLLEAIATVRMMAAAAASDSSVAAADLVREMQLELGEMLVPVPPNGGMARYVFENEVAMAGGGHRRRGGGIGGVDRWERCEGAEGDVEGDAGRGTVGGGERLDAVGRLMLRMGLYDILRKLSAHVHVDAVA